MVMRHDHAERALQVLEDLVRLSGKSLREVERECGLSHSYLAQLFGRRSGIKLPVLLKVLEVVEVHPLTFFKIVFRHDPPPEPEVERRLEERLEDASTLRQERGRASRPAPAGGELTPDMALLAERVADLLEERLRASAAAAPKRTKKTAPKPRR